MKKVFYILTTSLIASMVFFASCGDDTTTPELTPQQEQAKALTGTWSQSATDNLPTGVDPTVLDNLSLTFSSDSEFKPTSFSASGAPDFFTTSSASWSFGGSVTVVNLTNSSPVASISITQLEGSTLKISFTHPGLRIASNGKIMGLDGTYSVTLTK